MDASRYVDDPRRLGGQMTAERYDHEATGQTGLSRDAAA
jgi:hypothetical protein